MKISATMKPEAVRRSESTAKSSKGRRTDKGSADDSVAISDSAGKVRQLSDAAKETPEVRMDKILPLQEKIAKGEYHVPAMDIAESLVDHVIKHRMRSS